MKKHLQLWLWPAISFVVALLSSSTGGRALWCDEILRINGQHYTIDQLLAFKHLHDFCTQTPTGYLFMRPFQLLLGYEFGGNLVAALSAVVVTACVIFSLRRLNAGKYPSALACAIVALNPLLLYYGSELSFYGMFAAAFALAFAFALTLDDETDFRGVSIRYVGLAVSGAFFITFHFAGMFVWTGFAAAVCIDCLCRHGFKRAFNRGLAMLIPMLVNLPMYLGAEGKAIHLGTQKVAWDKLPGLPAALWNYVSSLFPSFTGGWLIGVAVFALGVYLLFRNRNTLQCATLALASIVSIVFFLSYSGLHDYVPPVARYWVYALSPSLLIVAFAVDWLLSNRRKLGLAVSVLMISGNLIADAVLFFADGRNYPYAKFQKALPADAPAVIYVNHYETRFFGRYYALPNGMQPVIPAYWEQGEVARANGLKLIHQIAPLCPAYLQDDSQERMAVTAGWVTGNRVEAVMPKLFPLCKALHLSPEPANANAPACRLLIPTEAELFAEAEKRGTPTFVPGNGWKLASMPPQKSDQPFTPVLTLAAGKTAELKVYVPKSCTKDKLTLIGYLGRGRDSAKISSWPLDTAKKGAYASVAVQGGKDGCYFLYPQIN